MASIDKPLGQPGEPQDVITRSIRRFAEGGTSVNTFGTASGGSNFSPRSSTKSGTTTSTAIPPEFQSIYNSMSKDDKKKFEADLKAFPTKSAAEKQTILGKLSAAGYDTTAIAKSNNLNPYLDPIKAVGDEKELGKFVGGAVKDVTAEADLFKDRLLNEQLPAESALTQQYYQGVQALPNVGNPTLAQAVAQTKDTYDRYGDAANYDQADYSDIDAAYRQSMGYDKTDFSDLQNKAAQAGSYNKTDYSDIDQGYGAAQNYNPADITTGDYTADAIKARMNPYEELVASRVRDRMREEYEQGRGERETAANRAGAFGGSAAAVQEMLARKQYEDRLKDFNAESASAAFTSGSDLYSKYLDMLRGEQLSEEESRQFGTNVGLQGLQGQLAAREQSAAETAKAKEAELQALSQQAALRQQEAEEVAKAKAAEQSGIAGLLDTRQQQAMETARAKETELNALQGQGQSSQLLGQQAAGQKEMAVTDLQGLQSAGQQQFNYALDKQQYPLELLQKTQNIYATGVSGTPLAPKPPKAPETPWYQTALGVGAGAVGIASGVADIFGFADGGIVQLHRSMFKDR